jgi:hypothetical protein
MNMIDLALSDEKRDIYEYHVTLLNALFSAKIRSFGRVTSCEACSGATITIE